MSNPMQDLHTLGLNPFAVTLLAESMLKSAYVKNCGTKPLTFEFPVRRSDSEGWAGVRITIEAVPVPAPAGAAGTKPTPEQFRAAMVDEGWPAPSGVSVAGKVVTVRQRGASTTEDIIDADGVETGEPRGPVHSCKNCAHLAKDSCDDPCAGCTVRWRSGVSDRWEPALGVKTGGGTDGR